MTSLLLSPPTETPAKAPSKALFTTLPSAPLPCAAAPNLESLLAFLEDKAHWVREYASTTPQTTVKTKAGANLAQTLLATLTSARFCRRKPAEQSPLLATLQAAIDALQPIPLTLIHGPLKNRNNVGYQHPDWAEWFTYCQLHRLGCAVKQLYAPGLSITLLLDDARSETANGMAPTVCDDYRLALTRFINDAGFSSLIQRVKSLRPVYESPEWPTFVAQATEIIDAWWHDPAHATRKEVFRLHAERNSHGLEVLTEDQLQQETLAAAYRYCIAFTAEQLAGVWNCPDTLTFLYNDYAGYAQLYTLRRGSISQPWQGKGAVAWDTTAQRWDPTLLTQSKYSQTPSQCKTPATELMPVTLKTLPLPKSLAFIPVLTNG